MAAAVVNPGAAFAAEVAVAGIEQTVLDPLEQEIVGSHPQFGGEHTALGLRMRMPRPASDRPPARYSQI